ncbi:MAG: hypothetical protein J7K34_07350 [Flavobacteriaceae bacterium]|nr:hypothetical protein [Flavobacteriaceae bacterium]
MKTIKYLLIFVLSITAFTSCDSLVDDTERTADFDKGPNLIGFTKAEISVSGISNGSEYIFELPMQGVGPTINDATEDVTLNISVDPSSTAIEGTHFKLSTSTMTFKASENYINKMPLTMLTEGIVAPLAVNPYVILNVTDVSGNFVDNGRTGQVKINLLYLCFSNLAGTYDVEMRYVNPDAGTDTMHYGVDTINETGDGQYRTEAVGHWEVDGGPGAIGGTAGFDFTDVCNEITIPAQNLVNLYSNIVEGVAGENYIDPDTGVIKFHYTICAGYCREYWVTYTPKK